MGNAQRLKEAMRPGRVYRRQELEGLTTAVDRDLKTLVAAGEVRKPARGLYCRPLRTDWGPAPPDDRELVRAFLKSDDFLLTSFDHYANLGLGLTQVYDVYFVYNHKRFGDFRLGGKRFRFRRVPAYPASLSKEYLLVDMLNNLAALPEDSSAVLANLKGRLADFDRAKVFICLGLYGNCAARRSLSEAYA